MLKYKELQEGMWQYYMSAITMKIKFIEIKSIKIHQPQIMQLAHGLIIV